MSEHHSPLEQFNVIRWFDFNLFGIDLSFTNSAFFMCLSGISALLYLAFSLHKGEIIPSKLQITGELFCGLIIDMVEKNLGSEGKQFIPFVFALFMFVLLCNCLGLMPYGFTVTSHVSITFALAICVFGVITIFGFVKHGRRFFSLFLPHGTPYWLAPLMVVIELFTFLARPVSLSLRLTANMVAGHVLLKVIAGFIVSLGLIWKFIPVPFVVILIGFEFFVAVLQAYIFAILTCVYLSDAVKLH